MESFLPILVVVLMFGVVGILLLGVATMARGGNPKWSNKLMQYRVALQALAVLVFVIFMLLYRR